MAPVGSIAVLINLGPGWAAMSYLCSLASVIGSGYQDNQDGTSNWNLLRMKKNALVSIAVGLLPFAIYAGEKVLTQLANGP